MRQEFKAKVQQLHNIIAEFGYDMDSTLLVFAVYKKGQVGKGKPLHYIVVDGNTRVAAVSTIDSISSLPCRVMEIDEGMYSYFYFYFVSTLVFCFYFYFCFCFVFIFLFCFCFSISFLLFDFVFIFRFCFYFSILF